MKNISYIAASLGLPLLLASSIAAAQDEPLVLDDSVDFGGDFGFDDDLFGDAFAEDSEANTESWLDDFTFKLSQQVFGQVNNHSTEVFPGFSIPKEPELDNNRLGLNVRYQNSFAAGWLLQASWQARVYWPEDYEYEANDDKIDIEYRMNEFFVQRSFGQQSLKFGRQTVVWGETVGNSVLDVINTTEFRDFTIIDIEDARLNQYMLSWDYFGEGSTVSTFVNLYPEFNPPAVRGSPFFFELPYNLTDYDRDEALFEVGTQWRKSFEGSDIAFMAAYLYENQLRYTAPESGVGDAVGVKNDFLLLGFSANRAIGKLLLSFDLSFSKDIYADLSDFNNPGLFPAPPKVKKDEIGASFGFEYAISNEQSISVGVQARKFVDEDADLAPGEKLFNEGVFGTALMRYSNSLMNGDLILSSTIQGELDGDSMLIQFGVNYTINDNWAVSSQVININANNSTALILFDEDVNLGATLTYTF